MQSFRDLPEKLVDGLAAAIILLLTTWTLVLMVGPLEQAYGSRGLFIYIVTLLAGMILCLERCVSSQVGDVGQARCGLAGGVLAWMVVSISSNIGAIGIANVTGMVSIFMAGIVVFMLWRSLPSGPKFFMVTFLLGWLGHILLASAQDMAAWLPSGGNALRLSGYVYSLGALAAMMRLFLFKGRSLDRTWAALMLWFFLTMALSAFQGELVL